MAEKLKNRVKIELKKINKTDFKDLVEYLSETLRYEVQDTFDLGTIWDTKLDKLERSFKSLIKGVLADSEVLLAQEEF